jgi:hypothetical protein
MADKNRIDLGNGCWVELGEGIDDMTMDAMADWVDAEREGRVRDVWKFLAMALKAWSFEGDPTDPASFGRLTIRQFRDVNAVVSKRLQDIAKN